MRACLFDIDGTLIRSGGAGKHAFSHALREVFGVDDVTDDIPFSGRTDRAILRDLFQHHGIEDSAAAWQNFRSAYLDHLPRSLAEREGAVLPGVFGLLKHLASCPELMLGLLTGNIAAGAKIKLDHYGLSHFFECGGYGDRHYDRNQVASEAFDQARAKCAEPLLADQVIVVGDTPADIRCGRSIGAQVIAVCTGEHSAEELEAESPDLLLADLTDPALALDAILQRG